MSAHEEQDTTTRPARAGLEPHRFKMTPFVFGLAFGAVGLAGVTEFSSDDTTAWLWVIAMTVIGIAGVMAALSRN